MMTLSDGRSELWQWDTGRTLSVPDDCSQVHFSNKVFGRSIDVDVVDGKASIPDVLLQTDKELTAWAFVGTPESGYTKISKFFKVNKRNKPADYVFTPPDQTTLGDILDRIEDLEKRPSGDVSEEDIQNAVNDYLEKNPVSIEEKDPTVPDWAKQASKPAYTAQEVGALSNSIAALPNPHPLTIGGQVYDGSEAVKVDLPSGGGNSDAKLELIRTVTVPADITTDTSGVTWVASSGDATKPRGFSFDTDENGNPFAVSCFFCDRTNALASEIAASASAKIATNVGEKQIQTQTLGTDTNTNRNGILEWSHERFFQTGIVASARLVTVQEYTLDKYDRADFLAVEQITGFTVTLHNTSAYWSEGTTIKFYGVRA